VPPHGHCSSCDDTTMACEAHFCPHDDKRKDGRWADHIIIHHVGFLGANWGHPLASSSHQKLEIPM
jgi:hypothetical protein